MNRDQAQEKANSHWSSWVILAVMTAPMLIAYIVYNTGFGLPEGTLNKGELLLPATDIKPLKIVDTNHSEPLVAGGKKIWRMVIVGNNDCDKVCEQMLYLSRQVHIRLGEKANRVERLYLNTESDYTREFSTELAEHHPRLLRAHVDGDSWRERFSGTSIAGHSLSAQNVYIVDQAGFAMMSYDVTHTGADLLDDIKRLLKYSYED